MKLTAQQITELTKLASKTAVEAGKVIQSMANNHQRLSNKVGGSSLASQVLTEADLKSQSIIFEALKPSIVKYDLGWLGEESPDDGSRLTKDYFWCVDPLDGTLPFTEGTPGYGVSIALIAKDGKPVIGSIYLPFYKRLVDSSQSLQAGLKDDQKLNFFCDRSFLKHPHYAEIMKAMQTYVTNHGLTEIEMFTQAGALVNAIGVMDHAHACYFKTPKSTKGGGSIWDYAATHAILTKAGAVVSDMSGNEMNLNNPDSTFMNASGILYTSDKTLANYIMEVVKAIK